MSKFLSLLIPLFLTGCSSIQRLLDTQIELHGLAVAKCASFKKAVGFYESYETAATWYTVNTDLYHKHFIHACPDIERNNVTSIEQAIKALSNGDKKAFIENMNLANKITDNVLISHKELVENVPYENRY